MAAIAVAGVNTVWSLLNATTRVINNPNGLSFTSKAAKVALPALRNMTPAFALGAVKAADNLILGGGKKQGVGLSFFSGRFTPITYGLCGLSTLLNWGANPMDPLTDAAFLGSITDGFGVKRAFEVFNREVDSPLWNGASDLLAMNALGGLTAFLFASFHLKGHFEDKASNYRLADRPQIWGNKPESDQPVWKAESRAWFKIQAARANYALWVGVIALPFLRASGASLPIFRSLNYTSWTTAINALRGAFWLAGTVIGADLVKVAKAKDDTDALVAILPEDRNVSGGDRNTERAEWNGVRDAHFLGLEYGLFDWFKAGLSFVADKSTGEHSWASKFTKLPQAGLLTAEFFFERAGNLPWAAFTGNAARNLRAWRKMGKVIKVINQPISFMRDMDHFSATTAGMIWGGTSLARGLPIAINTIGSATFSMMYDWMGMVSFVAGRAGYPLQGRVKALFDNASKRWACIPMSFALTAQLYMQYQAYQADPKGSSFYKVFYTAKRKVLGSDLDVDADLLAKATDYQKVATFVSRAGLTTLTAVMWYRGGPSKATDLAVSLFDALGASSGIYGDWRGWLSGHKDQRLKEDILRGGHYLKSASTGGGYVAKSA